MSSSFLAISNQFVLKNFIYYLGVIFYHKIWTYFYVCRYHAIILNTCKSFHYVDALLLKQVCWASWLLTMCHYYIYISLYIQCEQLSTNFFRKCPQKCHWVKDTYPLKALHWCIWTSVYTPQVSIFLFFFLCCPVAVLCLTLLCYFMDYSTSGSSVHGISQVRILEWVAIVCHT